MSAMLQTRRVGQYALSDAVIVLVLGILGGIINTSISSFPHAHFQLWGTQVPYLSFFTITPVIAMLLIRKPGIAFATALVYAIVQTILRGNPNALVFGFTEGLGAEIVFALFRYRVDPAQLGRGDVYIAALAAFLAGGIGAKTIGNAWSWMTTNNTGQMPHMMQGMAQPEQFAAWQTFLGGEILAFFVVGVLSGLGGWVLAELILRTQIVSSLRKLLDHAPEAAPQVSKN